MQPNIITFICFSLNSFNMSIANSFVNSLCPPFTIYTAFDTFFLISLLGATILTLIYYNTFHIPCLHRFQVLLKGQLLFFHVCLKIYFPTSFYHINKWHIKFFHIIHHKNNELYYRALLKKSAPCIF